MLQFFHLSSSVLHSFIRILIVYVLLGSCSSANADNGRRLKVGAVLDLTGSLNMQGTAMKNAMILAKEQFDLNSQLEFFFEDDGFIPKNTLSATNKLLHQDNIDVLVVFGTNQGMAVGDLAEKRGIPFLSINVNRKVVQGKKYALLLMPSVESLTAKTIQIAQKRGYKRVAVMATQQDSCLLQKKIFVNSGIAQIDLAEEFAPTERDFRDLATRVRRDNPDAVFLSLLPPQGSLIAKRLREVGYKGEFFGSIQIANLTELKASEGALLGAWLVSGESRQAKNFYSDYNKRFLADPTAEAIYAYDAVRLLIEGLKTPDVNSYLHSVKDFPGAAGKFSADGENGYTFSVIAKEFSKDGYEFLAE